MKKIMNFSTSRYDLERYRDNADLKAFYRGFHLDGIELLEGGKDEDGVVRSEDVVGVHLRYFTSFMDLWRQNYERLAKEYGDLGTASAVFGGMKKETLIAAYKHNLSFAKLYRPEYLVFHVSECTLSEAIMGTYHYTDEEVADAAIELVNSFLPSRDDLADVNDVNADVNDVNADVNTDVSVNKNFHPYLLLENLWHSGLTMLKPEIVERLLRGIHYDKVGIMLDTGHLLNTNPSLRTIDEGVDYIHHVLDGYPDLSFIKGIHLHQSLSGEYAISCREEWDETLPYSERLSAAFRHIFRIDTHQPFESARVGELLERICPEFLVYEYISKNREEHAAMLARSLI